MDKRANKSLTISRVQPLRGRYTLLNFPLWQPSDFGEVAHDLIISN